MPALGCTEKNLAQGTDKTTVVLFAVVLVVFVFGPIVAGWIGKARDSIRDWNKSIDKVVAAGSKDPWLLARGEPAHVRRAVAAQLSGDSDHMAQLRPLLNFLLQDEDVEVRRQAAMSLAVTPQFMVGFDGTASLPGAGQAIPALQKALSRTKNAAIRVEIERALRRWTRQYGDPS